jgi:nickel transport protein
MQVIIMNRHCSNPLLVIWLILLPVLVFWTDFAWAHGVSIFAWVEGDTVYTESKFSGGRLAKGALIEVYDQAGQKLLEGKTDDNGAFSFKLPKKEELKIVLVAGMGHRNEWTLTKQDLEGVALSQPAADPLPPPSQAQAVTSEKSAPASAPAANVSDLQAALEQSLDKKLNPIIRKLSQLEEHRKDVSLSDVIGGLGYILGLMGLAAYIQYRRK